jgi:hypothetical protein
MNIGENDAKTQYRVRTTQHIYSGVLVPDIGI